MADGFDLPEGTIIWNIKGQNQITTPGSKSMACNESTRVNVGDPDRSQKDRVSGNKINNQGSRKVHLGSQMCRSTQSVGKPRTWGRALGK